SSYQGGYIHLGWRQHLWPAEVCPLEYGLILQARLAGLYVALVAQQVPLLLHLLTPPPQCHLGRLLSGCNLIGCATNSYPLGLAERRRWRFLRCCYSARIQWVRQTLFYSAQRFVLIHF